VLECARADHTVCGRVDRSVDPLDIGSAAVLTSCRTFYKIMIPLPPKIDPSVTMMQVGFHLCRGLLVINQYLG